MFDPYGDIEEEFADAYVEMVEKRKKDKLIEKEKEREAYNAYHREYRRKKRESQPPKEKKPKTEAQLKALEKARSMNPWMKKRSPNTSKNNKNKRG